MTTLTDRRASGDEGFTLVEVVVALGLLGIVATAALAFFVTGVRTSAELQRRQVAVALTGSALEAARSVPVTLQTTGTGATATTWPLLVKGRDATSVAAQWAGTPELATTYPASDPAATSSTGALAPLRTSATVSNQAYSTSVLIGTCYRQRSASVCGRPVTARTAAPPAGYVEMVRVVAVTTWSPGAGRTCSGSACSYTASVLVDTTADPAFNAGGGRAEDDTATVRAGTSTEVVVLANDTITPATSSPVTITSTSSGVTATAAADGTVTITVAGSTPPGTRTVTYTARTRSGTATNTATVRVTVTS